MPAHSYIQKSTRSNSKLAHLCGTQEWKELFDKFFPAKAGAGKAAKFVMDERYQEAGEESPCGFFFF
jgi:hypothetical protein